MTSMDTETAINFVQAQLERYLQGDLDASARLPEREAWEKARRSGIVEPDGMGQWLRRPETGERAFIKGRLLDMEKLEGLVKAAAAGDKDADIQVCAITIRLLENEHSWPGPLRDFQISLVRARLPKTRGNRARDFQYCIQIYGLQEHGFSPTRNRALHGKADVAESGCSILSKALARMGKNVPERTLESIWEKYSNML